MNNHTLGKAVPLLKRPIDEIVTIAREAGRRTFDNVDTIEAVWFDARSRWLNENLPNALGLTDDEFDTVMVRAADAFKQGFDEYIRDMSEVVQTWAPRLPGVSIFFDESSTFRYGLQVDLSRFSAERLDAEALYQRFYTRLMSEYDRLLPHIAAAGGEPDAYRPKPDDEPISTFMLIDDVFIFQILPVALKRDVLKDALPAKLREFVTHMTSTEEECHE
ncbi:hypothetical protein R69658_07674 [Paraburkholderia aspalathi]|uniref:Uncharacterized protein n=1 Tax=Paraburkholderia aspalathi TaxID=1324617 RepID=A0ABN7NG87_9BURK|nr:hypothetical protein [Paraburkholderia aspalathi]MBK3823970.1 hypothetical protein [Paraburkholderia aspalathi]MBK3835811.1 hypothetical protein [Paraburkholderia aspalathi]MBK3865586.1 hypothetical protein [Paraburkholderia aspalathi]CAE6862173.1 hypothetical protein R69658_07674 [Paraburkholderia aspalathi]